MVIKMYNDELILISHEIIKDEIGNEIKKPIEKTVLCKVIDVGYREFYNAQVARMKPEIKFIVKDFEYNKQKEVKHNNVIYEVIRTYRNADRTRSNLEFDEIELTCEKVIGHGS